MVFELDVVFVSRGIGYRANIRRYFQLHPSSIETHVVIERKFCLLNHRHLPPIFAVLMSSLCASRVQGAFSLRSSLNLLWANVVLRQRDGLFVMCDVLYIVGSLYAAG